MTIIYTYPCLYRFLHPHLHQGLYEYVRPSWDRRHRPEVGEIDYKTFGATVQGRPSLNIASPEIDTEGGNIPRYVHSTLIFCIVIITIHKKWFPQYLRRGS